MSDYLKPISLGERINPLAQAKASVYSDLLAAALEDVDWLEIATNFLDE